MKSRQSSLGFFWCTCFKGKQCICFCSTWIFLKKILCKITQYFKTLSFFIIYWFYNWCQKASHVINFFSYFVPWQKKWFEGFTKGDIFLWVKNKAVCEVKIEHLLFSAVPYLNIIGLTCFIVYLFVAFISY